MSKPFTDSNYFYYAYYKPKGIECTMSPTIGNSLINTVMLPYSYFPLGRLDKDSEGLLILTNDGKLYKEIVGAETLKEKEYHVTVDKPITKELIEALTNGIEIMGQMTRQANVIQLNDFSFSIILTQGLNKQIRRMCYKMGFTVIHLLRTRMASLTIGNMKPGELIKISRNNIVS